MKLEDFNGLTEEEKIAFLASEESTSKQVEDLTAERDSFKTENEELKKQADITGAELKKTKELNFTLARKIAVPENKDDETILFDFMKGFNNGY